MSTRPAVFVVPPLRLRRTKPQTTKRTTFGRKYLKSPNDRPSDESTYCHGVFCLTLLNLSGPPVVKLKPTSFIPDLSPNLYCPPKYINCFRFSSLCGYKYTFPFFGEDFLILLVPFCVSGTVCGV